MIPGRNRAPTHRRFWDGIWMTQAPQNGEARLACLAARYGRRERGNTEGSAHASALDAARSLTLGPNRLLSCEKRQ